MNGGGVNTVIFEETGAEREVRRICGRCRVIAQRLRIDEPSLLSPVIVSPLGTAHEQSEDIPENTLCGIDATGRDWWWRL